MATAVRIAPREYVQRVFTFSEGGADGAARSWIMLFPLGEYRHESYGKLTFTRQRLSEIKRKFDQRVRRIDIALDADHAGAKGDTRATGWLEALEFREAMPDAKAEGGMRPAGLWGQVKWTGYGLTLLKSDEYRYFSPEFGPWKDPIDGRVYKDLLCGGGLTNRPFLKNMPAVMLSELRRTKRNAGQGGPKRAMETRTELPNGTVRIKRGPSPQEIERDERDAAARLAERGARETAKARKQATALLAEYERLTDSSAEDEDEFDETDDRDDGGELNATLRELAGSDEDDETDDETALLDDSMDSSSDGSDAGDETYDETDDGDDETEEDEPEPPMPAKKKAGKAAGKGKSKQMAQRANVMKGGSKTCAEIAAGPHTLSEARRVIYQLAEEREATRKTLHEHAVRDELSTLKIGALTLSEATAGKKTEQLAKAKLGLSKRFSDLYQEVLGAEGVGYLLDEDGRGDIRELVKTALSFAVVDLAQRGSGFDMEQRKTRRSGDAKRRQAEGGYATLAEETVALSEEKGTDLNELRRLAAAGNTKAKQELRKVLYEASARAGYGRD